MAHVRQQIREQVVTTVTGLTTTGSNVYDTRVYPLDDGSLPALSVYATDEVIDEDHTEIGSEQQRELQVVIEGRCKDTTQIEDTLDLIAKEVEVAVSADRSLGGLAYDCRLQRTELSVDDEAEQPLGLMRMEWRVWYRVTATDPETAL